MISYQVVFLSSNDVEEKFSFETNEKPFKGEIFAIQKNDGSTIEVKITEINKVLVLKADSKTVLEYHCKIEPHEQRRNAIGFRKDSN